MGLSERDRSMLDFEREWWTVPGTKEAAIRARFAVSASHYYRILGRILDEPDALAYDPLTVKRLLRQRGVRRRLRYEGRRAGPGTR
jgi:hypothetical protein